MPARARIRGTGSRSGGRSGPRCRLRSPRGSVATGRSGRHRRAGPRTWSDPVTDTVVDAYTARARRGIAAKERLEPLSDLERTVAELVAEGLSNSEIAARRYVSVSTVKATIARVFDKLGCVNRVQVAAVVLQAQDD
ncbi:MAG TPA: LuxR C-terminal-related transcriptional regulator [Candidatus Dietzia intestinipullorum]|nr:LuxR C-terminal-related transcriptional regulator [Candidatus Dietzia intestinipullorum]